ncbi:hypothetical protein BDW22DRAFT_1328044 [Trametopsis cervina]|nr:hypothetical protein BDW22DRAFT_1328044 [Trametopsis cervina]
MAEFEVGSSTGSRPVTPPPRPPVNLHLTPEQVKRIEINRLKAKAKQREREQASSGSSTLNANNKRPLEVVAATSTSPTRPKPDPKLRRDSRLGKYFEYDLSKMVNSKGGFLVDDDKEVDEELRAKEKERERERARQAFEPAIHLDPALNPKCKECGTIDIDQTYRKVFKCLVCNACKNAKPEKYSLLTKTECKEDYLLTDPELRDEELMPHLLKANPHKSTFANMMLFLRCQVEEFAWKKWGSAEALDAEYERRVAEKKKKKNKKFEEGLKELRKRTRETVWQRRKDAEHKHVFGAVVEKDEDGIGRQFCHTCGFTIQLECRKVSDALEVEQLDINLFRSFPRHFWVPAQGRGVFGGQVISQALVSATHTVDPAFAVHSLHCYFLASATPATILYHIERIRDGRSYVTRGVRAYQNGKMVFVIICSFQKPEVWQVGLTHRPPPDVPPPDECEHAMDVARRQANEPGVKPHIRDALMEYERTFLITKNAGMREAANGQKTWLYWHKVNDMTDSSQAFQKCILSYLSDSNIIGVARQTMGLSRQNPPGRTRLGMISSLDHSLFFYNNNFNCGDWLLYEVSLSRSPHGVIFTQSGDLVAVVTQEGVVRADIRDPSLAEAKL